MVNVTKYGKHVCISHLQPLVDGRRPVAHLLEHGLQHDDIVEAVAVCLLQHVDLVEDDVGVEDEVVRRRHQGRARRGAGPRGQARRARRGKRGGGLT